MGHDVTMVTLPKSIENLYYAELVISSPSRFRVVGFSGAVFREVTGGGNLLLLLDEWRYWRWFKLAYDEITRIGGIDFVVVPYLDYCLHVAGLRGSPFGQTPWTAITMGTSLHRQAFVIGKSPWGSWIRQELFLRVLKIKSLTRIFTIDEAFNSFVSISQEYSWLKSKVGYLPDPAELLSLPSLRESRARLGIEDDVFVILVFGSVTLRKGIAQLLSALSTDIEESDRNVCILVAGKCDQQVRELFDQDVGRQFVARKRLRVIDWYVEPELEATVFRASNVVWIGYVNHLGMSGVLVQAGQAGLPVIGPNEGPLSQLISKHGLGLLVDVSDPDSIRQSLKRFMVDSQFAAECGKHGLEKFQTHSPANFARLILENQANGSLKAQ